MELIGVFAGEEMRARPRSADNRRTVHSSCRKIFLQLVLVVRERTACGNWNIRNITTKVERIGVARRDAERAMHISNRHATEKL